MSLPPPLPDSPMPTPAPAAVPVRRGWWQRHWKWAVPTLVLCGLTVFAAALFGLFSLTMRSLRDSDAYRVALATAKTNPQIVADLGRPVEARWWATGNVLTNGDGSGDAFLQIPIEGPRGKGNLIAEASRDHGQWRFSTLFAFLDGSGRTVDLMASLPRERRAKGAELPTTEDRDECPTRPR